MKSNTKFWIGLIVLALLPLLIIQIILMVKEGETIEEEVIFKENSRYGLVEIKDGNLIIGHRPQCNIAQEPWEGERMIVNYSLDHFGRKNLDVLNIGLGCGLTTKDILKHTENQVDIVEINKVVIKANKIISDVQYNEKANIILDEGLAYLRKTDKKYDSIIIDIENPGVVHSTNLFTSEAFEIIENSLYEEGTFGLWVYPCANYDYYDIIYYTLKEHFNYVYGFEQNIFISSNTELEYEEFEPKGEKKINTFDLNILSRVFLNECWENKWGYNG